ncbi:MAG: hypothetical protein IJC27_10670, partial [Lentisphaeria bacterium]|nr:hypothetical protein [Lentisphaeria bacterium]
FLKIIAAISKRSVFGGYLFNSHAQTTALISSTLIFQSLFESVLKLPLEREICHCSNISFEQWIFLPCKLYKQICFKLKKGCCKTSSFATAPAKKQTTWHSALQ